MKNIPTFEEFINESTIGAKILKDPKIKKNTSGPDTENKITDTLLKMFPKIEFKSGELPTIVNHIISYFNGDYSFNKAAAELNTDLMQYI